MGRAEGALPDRLFYPIATLLAAVLLFPIFWALMTSLKPIAETYDASRLLPSAFQWTNYVELFHRAPFARWIGNTVLVTLLATTGTVLSSMMVGYAFARFRFPGRNVFFLLTISTLVLPAEVTIVPNYLLFRELGWLDTYLPLIVPYWLGGTAFYIFLFRQFFLTIPREYEEAARIDGANPWQVFIRVHVPMVKPAIAAATVISFIHQWDEFFTHLIYLNTPAKYTLPIGLRYFYNSLHTEGEPMLHLLMAAAVLALLPPIVIFLCLQRYFIRGVVMSGLKG
ncbi:MAG TPA: carbohydrate ABC transporter permease [Geminicoccaceae bacterium]|nr:carbohydrate ABC transporter permease [Geminicoccus sp.]HMU49452.1 carbohydrate ABC transporter permease [Geminicoccaceae bacterium]